jgi:iron complex transport system substrate-binding protein
MKTPERIVSLISSATEIIALLGADERLVGISHECDYPARVTAKPRLTRSLVDSAADSGAIDAQVRQLAAGQSALYAIDVERLAALAPDLVITQAQCDVCAVRYEDVVSAVRETPALAGTDILALNPHSLADVFDDVARVGSAIGATRAADTALGLLRGRVEAVRRKTQGLAAGEHVRVACLEWIDPPMLAANWTPQLVEWAGGETGLSVAGVHSNYAAWPDIVDYDPQVIVIMPCGFDLPRTMLEARALANVEGWSRMAAVRAGRVFAVDGNAYFNRSGPRLVDSLEILARLFHPRLFPRLPAGSEGTVRRLESRAGALVGAAADAACATLAQRE